MISIIDTFEIGLFPKFTVNGEPQRWLYPTIGPKGSILDINVCMVALAYADGNQSLFDIAKKIRKKISLVNLEVVILAKNSLISLSGELKFRNLTRRKHHVFF